MGKDKLRKWAENESFDIVFEPPLKEIVEGATFKQNEWGSTVFGNDNPITL
ncbi:MAG: tRNA (guanine-N7-)-methyltransferase, partial [Flavobacteriales bacterium]